MSFCVALQSAIFYYVSCSPCHRVKHMYKTKQQAKKDAVEKERYYAANPDIYRQPDPFNTNPYWSEEIMRGPHLETKKATRDASRQTLNSAGTDAGRTAGTSIGVSVINPPEVAETSSAGLNAAVSFENGKDNLPNSLSTSSDMSGAQKNTGDSSINPSITNLPSAHGSTIGLDLGGPDAMSAHASSTGLPLSRSETIYTSPEKGKLSFSTTSSTYLSDDWNHRRYQREDEELWGHELALRGHRLMNAIKHAGASAGRLVQETWGKNATSVDDDEDTDGSSYFAQRNPPVNDYHPPIVRQRPARKDAYLWMLQPPPPAKVMEGKIPPISRSSSMMSHYTTRTATPLAEIQDPILSIPSNVDYSTGRGRKAAQRPKLSTLSDSQDTENIALH